MRCGGARSEERIGTSEARELGRRGSLSHRVVADQLLLVHIVDPARVSRERDELRDRLPLESRELRTMLPARNVPHPLVQPRLGLLSRCPNARRLARFERGIVVNHTELRHYVRKLQFLGSPRIVFRISSWKQHNLCQSRTSRLVCVGRGLERRQAILSVIDG